MDETVFDIWNRVKFWENNRLKTWKQLENDKKRTCKSFCYIRFSLCVFVWVSMFSSILRVRVNVYFVQMAVLKWRRGDETRPGHCYENYEGDSILVSLWKLNNAYKQNHLSIVNFIIIGFLLALSITKKNHAHSNKFCSFHNFISRALLSWMFFNLFKKFISGKSWLMTWTVQRPSRNTDWF